ncbi:MAG: hypothetical protein K2L24_00730 [Opitutales bacterium]|nr:hypothetical protein [Opitutales bacterium]
MEQKLTLEKTTRQAVAIDNVFYGREVRFTTPVPGGELSVELRPHEAQLPFQIGVKVGQFPCYLLIDTFPPLEQLTTKFGEADLLALPESLQLLVLQEALEGLWGEFSKKLGVGIACESLSKTPREAPTGIDFVVEMNGEYATAGRLVAPEALLAQLAKKMTQTPRLRHLDNVEIPYRICVGQTDLSRAEYEDLGEGDIIFLDQYDLAKGQDVAILGLGEAQVRGQVTDQGLVVRQIG